MALSAKKRRLLGYGTALAVISALLAIYVVIGAEQRRRTACWQKIVAKVNAGEDLNAGVDFEISKFQELVEESLVARAVMLSLFSELSKRKESPLTGRDLSRLKAGTDGYLDLRQMIYDTAFEYECAVEVTDEFVVDHLIDPIVRMKAVMMSLAAALVLNDNYILAISLFEQDDRLRRVLNDPDSGFEISPNSLREIRRAASSPVIRYRVRRVLKFYESHREKLKSSPATEAAYLQDEKFAYLDALIQGSPSFRFIGDINAASVVRRNVMLLGDLAEDFIDEVSREGMDSISKFFGNTVGMYEARKGKLYGSEEALKHLASVMEPLDILLEKTPFRLTDKFIPGHFGHVAIWLGTESELRDLGVWDHPVVKEFHEQLRGDDPNSPRIVEALRSGVQLSTLEHFLNVDDVAVLRPVALHNYPVEEQRLPLMREALLLALRQVGKRYDFNFDVNTTDRIVCSELTYVSFPTIRWSTDAQMGRDTISPDRVAEKAFTETPLQLIAFYHDGKLVPKGGSGKSDLALMRRLMEKDVVSPR